MNDDAAVLEFENRKAFRKWLEKNHDGSGGIWLVLNKGSKTFSANDALEEALCFGWIDGLIRSIDGNAYKKYFSRRKSKEKWSDKNIDIFNKLKGCGLMTEAGMEAFNVRNGKKPGINRDDMNKMNINRLKDVLRKDEEVSRLFDGNPPSRQKQLAGFYCDAKTEETREKRRAKIIEALKSGNRGMLY